MQEAVLVTYQADVGTVAFVPLIVSQTPGRAGDQVAAAGRRAGGTAVIAAGNAAVEQIDRQNE